MDELQPLIALLGLEGTTLTDDALSEADQLVPLVDRFDEEVLCWK